MPDGGGDVGSTGHLDYRALHRGDEDDGDEEQGQEHGQEGQGNRGGVEDGPGDSAIERGALLWGAHPYRLQHTIQQPRACTGSGLASSALGGGEPSASAEPLAVEVGWTVVDVVAVTVAVRARASSMTATVTSAMSIRGT
ncbi:hypothetical protein GBA65_02230 [Rubrobacter marinus]|uniref:Uncharacterized protein n=1 Tax=Rubrobacter marinus TaxID=2653852 RepID=A0A6G8PT41_9ACTN|nr:hypothetical protein [Rubrobacter marinus]QIN77514.1 hypothetical protein GBA65_02230 [Rubrobacter marinus]